MKIIIFIIIIIVAVRHWYLKKLTDTGRIVTKGVFIWCLAGNCVLSLIMLIGCIGGVAEMIREHSETERKEMIEWDYYNGNYSELRECLMLYDCFEEEFAPYWEITEAQQCYHEYLIYEKAAGQNSEKQNAYATAMQEKQKRLQILCEESKFEQNRELLAYYMDLVK